MSVEAHLEINPPDILEFSLSKEEATPKVILTLNHPDADNDTPIAFKVSSLLHCLLFSVSYHIMWHLCDPMTVCLLCFEFNLQLSMHPITNAVTETASVSYDLL